MKNKIVVSGEEMDAISEAMVNAMDGRSLVAILPVLIECTCTVAAQMKIPTDVLIRAVRERCEYLPPEVRPHSRVQ